MKGLPGLKVVIEQEGTLSNLHITDCAGDVCLSESEEATTQIDLDLCVGAFEDHDREMLISPQGSVSQMSVSPHTSGYFENPSTFASTYVSITYTRVTL